MMPMDASRLARLAYAAMADSVSRMQREAVEQEAINQRFGLDALPVSKIRRGYANLLATEAARDKSKMLDDTMADYLEAMRELEKLFKLQEDENMEAFAKAMAERFRMDQAAEKKRRA